MMQWRDLLEEAAHRLDDEWLGFHLSQFMTLAHFGVVGYVLHACTHLAQAMQRFNAYQRLFYDNTVMDIRVEGGDIVLEWLYANGLPGQLVDETALACLLQMARRLTGTMHSPTAVHFVNPCPSDVAPYEAFFGCPVLFSQPRTRVAFGMQLLALPVQAATPGVLQELEHQAGELLSRLPGRHDALMHIRQTIVRMAREGCLSQDTLAEALHLSKRTLHRRLEEHQTNYRDLRDETLCAMAKEYLSHSALELSEIALMLGYSEQSAFNRAFKRMTGVVPLQYRRGQGAAAR
jgi:AraC-like DNA-binding protein